MFPVLFDLDLGRFGQFTVGTYGLFYAVGFLLALRLGVAYARKEGIPTGRIVDLGIVTLLAGFIGAKLLLYLLDFRYYLQRLEWRGPVCVPRLTYSTTAQSS